METEKKLDAPTSKKRLIPVFDLFENSWKMYRENFKPLILISLYGLLALAAIFVGALLIGGVAALFSAQLALVWRIILIAIICIIALATIAAAIWYSTRSKLGSYLIIKNNFSSVRGSWQESKGLFWPFFGLSLLVLLLIIAWSILLIIPGIIFGVFYSFAVIVFVFEGKKGMKAIKASKELVKGYWWPTFGRLAFIGLVLYIFSLIVSLPGAAAQNNAALSAIWSVVDAALMFVVAPVLYVYTTLLYQNLKAVKK